MADDDAAFREATFTSAQHEFVLKACRAYAPMRTSEDRKGAIRALELARLTDLPPVHIDWTEEEKRAAARGGSLADLIFDEAKGKED